jgi:segregation and condensation protein B
MPRLKVVMPADEPEVAPVLRAEELRLLEAMLFASAEPLDEASLAERLPRGVDVHEALLRLQEEYASRGVNLVRVAGRWTFRTATDLAWLLSKETQEARKLSRAAMETLAIIAYHQPVTRAEIEEIRGVTTSKGSVDVLLQTGWIRPRTAQDPGSAGHLRDQRGFPVAFRARFDRRSARARRAQGLGPARRTAAVRVLGAHAIRRPCVTGGRGSAGAG